MTLLEEIKGMQAQGKSDQEIISELRTRKIPEPQIMDALSQSKIKEAISAPIDENEAPQPTQETPAPSPTPVQETQEQPQQSQPTQEQVYAQAPSAVAEDQAQQYQGYDQTQQQYAQQPQQAYPEQQYAQQQTPSSDTINEIAEQVVQEKIASIQDKLESALNMETTFEANIESLDERLKRIEKIIDRLQLSILQKVGSYLTNVDDIKKELEETRKSFKSALAKSNKPSTSSKSSSKIISKK